MGDKLGSSMIITDRNVSSEKETSCLSTKYTAQLTAQTNRSVPCATIKYEEEHVVSTERHRSNGPTTVSEAK
jgi:hypothetical protein